MLKLMSTFEGTAEFLEINGVHKEWADLFHDNPHIRESFANRLDHVYEHITRTDMPLIPEDNNILRALSGCGPGDVKVVIVGHDPIRYRSLATGYAFSFPPEEIIDENVGHDRPLLQDTGRSVAVLHDALVQAGYLEEGGSYDCCHEQWVGRGVLLLNASLTYPGFHHFEIWQTFTKQLLREVIRLSQQNHLYFLFWGTDAGIVGDWLSKQLENDDSVQTIKENHRQSIHSKTRVIIFIGDHPTHPKDENKFLIQASDQFRTIKEYYSDIFALPNLKNVTVAKEKVHNYESNMSA